MSEWISVAERLPDESDPFKRNIVLAWFDWGRAKDDFQAVQLAEISCGAWRPYSGNGDFNKYVTHWMPLPEAPK